MKSIQAIASLLFFFSFCLFSWASPQNNHSSFNEAMHNETMYNEAMYNKATLAVKIYQVQERYQYGEKVLRLALSKLKRPFELEAPEQQGMNEARGELEVIAGNIDIQWLSTTPEREAQLIPIRIPLYRGILGLRLLLARHDRHNELSQIQSLTDLRNYTGGHGLHWGDLPVYEANQLPVITHIKYEHLFEMLKHKRFDYFHRGANEIWPEQKQHEASLSVVDDVMLYYPHPVYFFVTPHKPWLAKLLEEGLNEALKDGSFEHLFKQTHAQMIKRSNFKSRRLIELKNPVIPKSTPDIDTSWWLTHNINNDPQKKIR